MEDETVPHRGVRFSAPTSTSRIPESTEGSGSQPSNGVQRSLALNGPDETRMHISINSNSIASGAGSGSNGNGIMLSINPRQDTDGLIVDELEGEDEDGVMDDSGDASSIHSNTFTPWSSSTNSTRPRNGSGSSYVNAMGDTGRMSPETVQNSNRLQRPPAPIRTPSNTYAPVRHPMSLLNTSSRHRSASATRSRRDPNALYRSQEKAYVQRIRQDTHPDYFSPGSDLSFYRPESELEDESPSEVHFDNNDLYDGDSLLLYGQDDMEPSPEELKIPENRERLEWHTMLASVLMGDVVRQEKRRLIGSAEGTEDATMRAEVFLGIRAKVCGRSPAAQRRMIDDGRSKADTLIDEVTHFEIQGKDKTDKTPNEQVEDIITRWERCEQLWSTRAALIEAKPNCASPAFNASWDAIIAWNNITQLINTELKILQNWVGNEELDFQRTTIAANNEAAGIDRESSFLDRILKDDNLKSLTGKSNMLIALSSVIGKAKQTLITYAEAFEKRHLPPYVEELLVLIGFPTRLIEEVIGMRLQYAERMREPVSMVTDRLISQFQSVLQLAVKIKQEYTEISQPEAGWDLPPCMDENFEQVVLHGLKYYFKLIGWRIGSNRNTFKEAEILETEWHFSNQIGRYIEGGDTEVAEHFRFGKIILGELFIEILTCYLAL
jgi:mitogen-activated protein kinase kinase kinase